MAQYSESSPRAFQFKSKASGIKNANTAPATGQSMTKRIKNAIGPCPDHTKGGKIKNSA